MLTKILDESGEEVYTCAITVAKVISKVAREKRDVNEAYSIPPLATHKLLTSIRNCHCKRALFIVK